MAPPIEKGINYCRRIKNDEHQRLIEYDRKGGEAGREHYQGSFEHLESKPRTQKNNYPKNKNDIGG